MVFQETKLFVDKLLTSSHLGHIFNILGVYSSSVLDLMDNDNSILEVALMWEKPMNFSERVSFSQKIQMDKSDVLLNDNDMPNWTYYNDITSTQL